MDTTVGAAFDELLKTREISEGQLDDVPIMRLPRNFPLERGELFMPFLDPSTRIGSAKQQYIGALRTVIESGMTDIEAAKRDVHDASRFYMDRIIELMSPIYGQLDLETVFNDSFTVAFGQMTDASDRVVAVAAPTAGLAISVRDEANQRGRQFLIEKFRLRDVTDRYDPSREHLIRFQHIRPEIASLAFDAEEAAKFIADIPRSPVF